MRWLGCLAAVTFEGRDTSIVEHSGELTRCSFRRVQWQDEPLGIVRGLGECLLEAGLTRRDMLLQVGSDIHQEDADGSTFLRGVAE